MSTNYLSLKSVQNFAVGGSTITDGSLLAQSSNRTIWNTTLAKPFTVSSLSGSTITTQTLVTSAVTSTLSISTADTRRKLVLNDAAFPGDTQRFYGIGLSSNIMNFTVSTSTDAFAFYAGSTVSTSTEVMRITGAGNVGIGIIPSFPLDVSGLARIGNAGASSFQINLGQAGVGSFRSGYIYGDGTTMTILNQQAGDLWLGTNNGERVRITSAGNVGIGTNVPTQLLSVNGSASFSPNTITRLYSSSTPVNATWDYYASYLGNSLYNGSSWAMNTDGIEYGFSQMVYGWRSLYFCTGSYSGLSQSTLTNAQMASNTRMIITGSGNVGIGTTSPDHSLTIYNPNQLGTALKCKKYNASSTLICDIFQIYGYNSSNAGWNTADGIAFIAKDTTTDRSINAYGTVNASGADYAEYMYKSDPAITFQKGDIVGVTANRTLTNEFDQAATFLIKSTDPSYVGGDVWASEAILGKKPEPPSTSSDSATSESAQQQYEADLAAWTVKFEAERKKVDRIAFAGQVPCNVLNATVGDYLIPVRNQDGTIGGASNPPSAITFEQYQKTVGKVIQILTDGRAMVIVKTA